MPAVVTRSPSNNDATIDRLIALGTDFRPFMAKVAAIMTEDHTRANLMGIGGDGISYKPVTYRGDSAAPTLRRNRGNRGIKPALTGAGDNLTSAQYRRLTGPPLAPRGKDSRIIRNYTVEIEYDGTVWKVRSYLRDVVDKKGRPFMQFHFDGAGRLPRRDDRGIRPWGREEIRRAREAEVRRILRGN